MPHQHHEAMNPATSTPAWALIFVHSNGKQKFILSSSWAVTCDCKELGYLANGDIEIPCGDEPGFHLWDGSIDFDGLDRIDYNGNAWPVVLTPIELAAFFDKHEENDPRESLAAKHGVELDGPGLHQLGVLFAGAGEVSGKL